MAKIIAWLIVIFVVLLALRLVNARNAAARRRAQAPDAGSTAAQTVRCQRCGVFLPRSDAVTVSGGFACADARCDQR
jgi:hypothetical protein